MPRSNRGVRARAASVALKAAADELRDGRVEVYPTCAEAVAGWLEDRAELLAVLVVGEPCPACEADLEVVDGLIVCAAGCDQLAVNR